ncbi:MAG TPA: serine hydrolase [Chitinophagaceae bacterium]|nr:serine hydrolase [Chitinophagaceae bacterium]
MYKQIPLLIFSSFILIVSSAQKPSLKKLKKEIITALGQQPGVFALAFKDLQTGKTLFIHEHEIFHAASTMKTPVLIEAYKQAAEGKLALTDSITIINEFKSIADSSHFSLDATDDSELELYKHIGEKSTLYNLLYQMIISSSNLATNIVIDKLGATNVMATIRSMGAKDIQVLRGVEDDKAYEKGLNNVVSAYDLALLFEKMANGKIVNQDASQAMIKILLDQKFKDIIPAKLPAGVKVAHKTGWITGIHHDSGIVFLPDGKKYVLVLLSKNLTDDKAGIETMANVSEMMYNYVNGKL